MDHRITELDDPNSPLLPAASPSPSSFHHFHSPLPSHPLLVSSRSAHAESGDRQRPAASTRRSSASSTGSEFGILSTLSSLFNLRHVASSSAAPASDAAHHASSIYRQDASTSHMPYGGVYEGARSEGGPIDNDKMQSKEDDDRPQGSSMRSRRLAPYSPFDLPPTPDALPGAWRDDTLARTDGSLLLPPPFLDESSSLDSFDGLFGSRAARQSKAASLRVANLIARDRPPLPPFPQSLLITASKLIAALGPPDWSIDDVTDHQGVGRSTREGLKRTERAERGLWGMEAGQRWIERWYNMDRGRSDISILDELAGTPSCQDAGDNLDSILPATPLSMFSPTPNHATLTPTFLVTDASAPPSPFRKPKLAPTVPLSSVRPTLLRLNTGGSDDSSNFDSLSLDSGSTAATASSTSSLPTVSSCHVHLPSSYSNCGSTTSFHFFLHAQVHLIGFLYFVSIHILSLVGATLRMMGSIGIYSHWTMMNLAGRTELSIVVYESFTLCHREWTKVGSEDGLVSLGVTNIVVGLLELFAVHQMSRRRYLLDGPGNLVMLLGAKSNKREMGMAGEQEEDSGGFLVTGGDDSILSATIVNNAFDFSTSPPTLPSSPPLRPLPPLLPLDVMYKTIKRLVKYGAASYGLHSYILLPPSPLGVASSNAPLKSTLPQRIFSRLGQIDEKNVLHFAIQQNYLDQPASSVDDSYTPAFYVLRDDINSEIVCVIRGTQSLSDIKTDLETTTAELELCQLGSISKDESVSERSMQNGAMEDASSTMKTYTMHAGILATARSLVEKESVLLKKLITALEESEGYSLVFTGHSLGAGIASALVLLVSQYTPSPLDSTINFQGRWTTSSRFGLPPNRPIRSFGFAHPATLDAALSKRCAAGIDPLVTSISNGPDVVCRIGVPQVCEVRRILGRLAIKRRKFLQHRRKSEHGQLEILRSWWTWKRMTGKLDMEQDDTVRLIEEKAWEWRKEIEQFEGLDETKMYIPAGRCFHLDFPVASGSLAQSDGVEMVLYRVGNPAAFYASPHLESDAISSHLPRNYLDAVEML